MFTNVYIEAALRSNLCEISECVIFVSKGGAELSVPLTPSIKFYLLLSIICGVFPDFNWVKSVITKTKAHPVLHLGLYDRLSMACDSSERFSMNILAFLVRTPAF